MSKKQNKKKSSMGDFKWGNLVPGVIPLLGEGINAWAQASQNKKNRQFSEKMYNRQRADSLADWNMMNAYNSPAAQMQRFKEAGLNKNLIYGQTNEGATVRSSDYNSPQQSAPQIDLSKGLSGLLMYADIEQKGAQTDNLKKALETADQQIKLIQAQTAESLTRAKSTAVGTDKALFDLALATQLRPLTVEAAEIGVKKQKADLEYTVDQNIRAAVQNATSVLEAFSRLETAAAGRKETLQRIENMKQEFRIRKYDEKLLESGARPGDALWQRKLVEYLKLLYDEFFNETPSKNYPGGPLEGVRQKALEMRKQKNK